MQTGTAEAMCLMSADAGIYYNREALTLIVCENDVYDTLIYAVRTLLKPMSRLFRANRLQRLIAISFIVVGTMCSILDLIRTTLIMLNAPYRSWHTCAVSQVCRSRCVLTAQ